MRIELKKGPKKTVIGYDIISENEDEQKTLGSVRNLVFFGIGSTNLVYDGMEHDEKKNLVTKLKFIQECHQKKLKSIAVFPINFGNHDNLHYIVRSKQVNMRLNIFPETGLAYVMRSKCKVCIDPIELIKSIDKEIK